MKQSANKNLEPISLDQVKDFIKLNDPVNYDKMIISSSEIVKRTNFIYLNYSGEYLNRSSKSITFPMYGTVKDNFSDFSGGVSKLGEKVIVNSNHIFNTLSSNYQIEPEKDFDANKEELNFPIAVNNDEVSSAQPLYFLPIRTMSWGCEKCNSKKHITCSDNTCAGRHEWECTGCQAKGTINCNKCSGNGRLDCSRCNGSNKVSCSNCGGDGRVGDGVGSKLARGVQDGRQKDQFFQDNSCGDCSGKGRVNCSSCNSGKVTCSKCSGNGKVTCSECDGMKKIKCSKCYGDKERYGMIDCPECKAMGEMAKISFVETKVNQKSISRIFNDDGMLKNVTGESIMKFAKASTAQVNILRNFNDVFEQNYDELVKDFIEKLHVELDFHLNGFENRVTREELYYQVIPCVQIEYRHMISNTIHFATILNYIENPELIIDNEVENEKSNAKDKMKMVGNFFGKLFKTKAFKIKEDRKKEIKLLIMIAKIDGKIEDEEKIFLASQISSLDDFSVVEKLEFFTLMDTVNLPKISYIDVAFSTPERFQTVIELLESLAGKDGSIQDSEKSFIENIKKIHAEGKKK
jgi:hypothetical protein